MELDKDLKARQEARDLAKAAQTAQNILARMPQEKLDAIVEAVVTTAAALNDEQREKLLEKLRSMTGKAVALKEKVDAGLLGGVLLEMDGKRYDNTLRHRLENLQNILSGNA